MLSVGVGVGVGGRMPILVLSLEIEAKEEMLYDLEEGLAELDVQERVQNGIESRVEPEEPKGEFVGMLVHACRTHRLYESEEGVGRLI